MKLKLIILLSLTIFISSGSFDLESYLSKKIIDNNHSNAELIYARDEKIQAALIFDSQNQKTGTQQWLESSIRLAKLDSDIAIQLANHYLDIAEKANLAASTNQNIDNAIKWLEHAIRLGNGLASIELAYLYYDLENNLKASRTLEPVGITDQSIGILLELAIEQGNIDVILSLVDSKEYENAIKLLRHSRASNTISKSLSETNLTKAYIPKVLIDKANNHKKERLRAIDPAQTGLRKSRLLSVVELSSRYQVINQTRIIKSSIENGTSDFQQIELSESPQCENSLQFLASSFEDLTQAEKLIKEVGTSDIGQYFCFDTPRYVPRMILSCASDSPVSKTVTMSERVIKAEKAIECDENKFELFASSLTSKYLALILEEGGANVHYGVLYIDSKDTSDVLRHELSHLLGFADEYPLRKSHQTCMLEEDTFAKATANNIVIFDQSLLGNKAFGSRESNQDQKANLREKILEYIPWRDSIKPSTPIMQYRENNLTIGTPNSHIREVGLFGAQTCRATETDAYKPLHAKTLLEHNELAFPEIYEDFLSESKSAIDKIGSHVEIDKVNAFSMPSFHYNIALANFMSGNVAEAKKWLKLAATYELNESKKQTIKKGAF